MILTMVIIYYRKEKTVRMSLIFIDTFIFVNQAFDNSTTDLEFVNGEYVLDIIDLNSFNLTIDEGVEVIKTFLLDNPQVYWLSNTFTFIGMDMIISVEEAYAPYLNRVGVNEAVYQMIEEVGALITHDMNDLEIAKTIHDYIILRVDYAYESDGVTPQDDYWAHNIDGVANQTGAVCEGYAETYKLLADYYGIHTNIGIWFVKQSRSLVEFVTN